MITDETIGTPYAGLVTEETQTPKQQASEMLSTMYGVLQNIKKLSANDTITSDDELTAAVVREISPLFDFIPEDIDALDCTCTGLAPLFGTNDNPVLIFRPKTIPPEPKIVSLSELVNQYGSIAYGKNYSVADHFFVGNLKNVRFVN